MKNKIIYLVISIITYLLMSSSSCRKDTPDCHQNIFVDNQSTKDIYILPSWKYPDTVLSLHPNITNPQITGETKVEVGKKASAFLPRRCWEIDFINGRIGKDTLLIYLLDAQIVEKIPWDSIKVRNLYLKRFDLSLKNLQDKNWQLTFP